MAFTQRARRFMALALAGWMLASSATAGTVWIEELGSRGIEQGFGRPGLGKSVEGTPLTLAGKIYTHGLGTHADGVVNWQLDGQCERFSAVVGVDDEVAKRGPGSVVFRVLADGKQVFESGVMKGGEAPKTVDLPMDGVKVLTLLVTDAEDGNVCDHADWADAKFEMKGDARPKLALLPQLPGVILTPPAGPKPRINGAKVFGVRPGNPVLYTIAATGARPMQYSVQGLPKGLQVDAKTGQITGVLPEPGEHAMTVEVSNAEGAAKRSLKIVVGEQLALTPPMGWNSWNCWAGAVDQDKVLRAGKAMAASGLADHGWTYINIDDCWMEKDVVTGRAMRANEKFPDMKGLCDQLHAMGLKAGLYSSPGPKTCAQYSGSYQHEAEDVAQWAAWGFDYLKYDWCSYGEVVRGDGRLETLQKPYKLMGDLLRKQNRDIVYSLCQYGMGNVASWGAEVGGQCWRTTGDIVDTWGSVSSIARAQARIQQYISPGHWNDPDMLVVGMVGWGPRLHPTRLTPDEQYTHISLWSLLQSPLLLGCDLERLDPFTLNLLTNDEVLEVNQDPAGKPAVRASAGDQTEIWVKELEDGSRAVGLFNMAYVEQPVKANWKALGLADKQQVRDLWRQKDLGEFADGFEATVPAHGVVLVKVRGR